ncbi:MAG: hypothetical protein ABJC74_07155 [Gemmatimonadota bacterium]
MRMVPAFVPVAAAGSALGSASGPISRVGAYASDSLEYNRALGRRQADGEWPASWPAGFRAVTCSRCPWATERRRDECLIVTALERVGSP